MLRAFAIVAAAIVLGGCGSRDKSTSTEDTVPARTAPSPTFAPAGQGTLLADIALVAVKDGYRVSDVDATGTTAAIRIEGGDGTDIEVDLYDDATRALRSAGQFSKLSRELKGKVHYALLGVNPINAPKGAPFFLWWESHKLPSPKATFMEKVRKLNRDTNCGKGAAYCQSQVEG